MAESLLRETRLSHVILAMYILDFAYITRKARHFGSGQLAKREQVHIEPYACMYECMHVHMYVSLPPSHYTLTDNSRDGSFYIYISIDHFIDV